MDSKYDFQVLLCHYWKQGVKATEAVRMINAVEGVNSITIRTAQNWFKKFSNGDTNLLRKKGSGRPSIVNSEALVKAVEKNPRTSTRKLSAQLGPSKSTICRHLHLHGKVNRRCREIPHELSAENALRRVDICKELLKNPFDSRFTKRIVTSDEKWIYFTNPDTSNQWLDIGQTAFPVVKHQRFERKVMLCVWWNYEGVIHFELIPNGKSIDSKLYSSQLHRMYEKLKEKYPSLVNRKRVLLQQDNAKPHTAIRTKKKIVELEGIELLPHPAYSPDLAPSDYYLFRSLAHFLRGRSFSNVNDVEIACLEFFSSKSKQWYLSGIQELSKRWLKTIEHNGLYFDI